MYLVDLDFLEERLNKDLEPKERKYLLCFLNLLDMLKKE